METIGEDFRQMIRTPLAPSHVEALRSAGKVVTYVKGTIMAQPGETANRCVYVEEGEIEVINPVTGERHYPSTIGPTQFMGERSACSTAVPHLYSRRPIWGLAIARTPRP